jgi:pimeloyl-ACP methyl ester carboxylesterase
MSGLYARWMDRWERRLAGRDSSRVVRPFEWGWEWADLHCAPADPDAFFRGYSQMQVQRSEQFFGYERPQSYTFEGGRLRFRSPVRTPYPENNVVWADYFPAEKAAGRAVLVLPQWNADEGGHVALCKLLNLFGMSALRLNLAYHGPRRPAGESRADFHVSPNIGRTIHAGRQSVVDARACLDWLESQGYTRIGILGTSLGSCIAYITAAHDVRVRAGAFNHVSVSFGDVVWTGLATRHVRQGLEGSVTQDQLREYWWVISPAAYLDRMTGRRMPSLFVWARYDTTFLPEFSRQLVSESRRRGHPIQEVRLPCGHYTTGEFPFNLLDAIHMCRFLRRCL